METQMYLYPVLLTALAGAAVFVLLLLGRFLQTKVGATEYASMMKQIRDYVTAAEQMAKAGTLAKDARYQFVVSMIVAKFPQLTQKQITAYVEAAVHVVNAGASLMENIDLNLFGEGDDDETFAV